VRQGSVAEAHLGTVSPRNAFLDPSVTLSPLDGGLQVFVKRLAEIVFGRRAQYLLQLRRVPAHLLLDLRGFVLQQVDEALAQPPS
jgi:hypothetical protein